MTTKTMTTTAGNQIPGMPEGLNPDTLDTLTELAVLLNRLRTPTSTTGTGSGTTPAPSSSQPAPPPPSQPQRPNQTQQQTNNGATTTTNMGELSLKEISPAADVLKHRFQRARALVRGLPDVGRGIAEQEAEVVALEARLARQRDMLARLREMGASLAVAAQEEGDGGDMMIMD